MNISEKMTSHFLRETVAALRKAKDEQTAFTFFCTLLTPPERKMLALRWRLVCLLRQCITQREISRLLGISLCKITRGSRELKHGPAAFRNVVDEHLKEQQTKKGK